MMKYIISATNRLGANSFIVAQIIQKIYQSLNADVEVMSLRDIPFPPLVKNSYPAVLPKDFQSFISKLNKSSGFIIVCPEYNGSFPGIFKFFIDHWSYPETFEYRPMAFVGLGGKFGGLRAVEQLQQIMGYRNGFIYPERVFLQNIEDLLVDEQINPTGSGQSKKQECSNTIRIKDPEINNLLYQQSSGFLKFISALEEKGLSACARP